MCMALGLHKATTTFQHLVDSLLALWEEFTLAYLHDIIISSKIWADHLEHLDDVFWLLRNVRLKLDPKKSKLGFQELEYLGYVVGHGHLKP